MACLAVGEDVEEELYEEKAVIRDKEAAKKTGFENIILLFFVLCTCKKFFFFWIFFCFKFNCDRE
jgi:hypothetical protein